MCVQYPTAGGRRHPPRENYPLVAKQRKVVKCTHREGGREIETPGIVGNPLCPNGSGSPISLNYGDLA
jgi:hypothetical protein